MRLYETLFTKENPNEVEEGQDFTANLNPEFAEVLTGCKVEPSVRERCRAAAISSSGWATSAWITDSTPEQARVQSDRWRCAMRGRRSNNAENSK